MKTVATLLAGSLLAWQPPASAQDNPADAAFGRLFFSAERRAALDRQRLLNIQEIRTLEGETLQLDGVVQRSSGKRTVWINGKPQDETDEVLSGIGVRLAPRSPGAATITAGENEALRLKVGEAINRATGDRDTRLGEGAVIKSGRR